MKSVSSEESAVEVTPEPALPRAEDLLPEEEVEVHVGDPRWPRVLEIARFEQQLKRSYPVWQREGTCYRYERTVDKVPKWSRHIKYHDSDFLHTPYTMVIAATRDIALRGPLQSDFRRQYGNRQLLFDQRKVCGDFMVLGPAVTAKRGQYLFYLLTKTSPAHRSSVFYYASALVKMRAELEHLGITDVAFPVLDPGLDGILWRTTYRLLDVIFQDTAVCVHVYTYFYASSLYCIEPEREVELTEGIDDYLMDWETRTILNTHFGCQKTDPTDLRW